MSNTQRPRKYLCRIGVHKKKVVITEFHDIITCKRKGCDYFKAYSRKL